MVMLQAARSHQIEHATPICPQHETPVLFKDIVRSYTGEVRKLQPDMMRAAKYVMEMGQRSVDDPQRLTALQAQIDLAHSSTPELSVAMREGLLLNAEAALKELRKQTSISWVAVLAALEQLETPKRIALIHGETPSLSVVHSAYLAKCALVEAAIVRRPQNKDLEQKLRHVGALSELAINMLLDRFVLKESIDDWAPVQSTLSEDINRFNSRNNTNSSWDISVFTPGANTQITQTYRLQVKTSRDQASGNDYDFVDGIAKVEVKEDLAIGKEVQTSPRKILSELRDEYRDRPKSGYSTPLNKREDLLLDKIDT